MNYLVIGLGNFGSKLAIELQERKHEVLAVDKDEARVNAYASVLDNAYIGDCMNPEVLKRLGINNFDAVIVAIEEFQASLEIAALSKELGAKRVIAKAHRDIQAKFLMKNGADEVVYPDRDTADKLAVRLSAKNIFDYIELSDEYVIVESALPPDWKGKSLVELELRKKYGVNVLSVRRGNAVTPDLPPDEPFREEDRVFLLGKKSVIGKLTGKKRI